MLTSVLQCSGPWRLQLPVIIAVIWKYIPAWPGPERWEVRGDQNIPEHQSSRDGHARPVVPSHHHTTSTPANTYNHLGFVLILLYRSAYIADLVDCYKIITCFHYLTTLLRARSDTSVSSGRVTLNNETQNIPLSHFWSIILISLNRQVLTIRIWRVATVFIHLIELLS